MSDANPTVLVIDDDPDVRGTIGLLLRSLGIGVQLFASISDFLKSDLPDGPTCIRVPAFDAVSMIVTSSVGRTLPARK